MEWWDHRSKKVNECQSCNSACVNGAVGPVGVNLGPIGVNGANLGLLGVNGATGFVDVNIFSLSGFWGFLQWCRLWQTLFFDTYGLLGWRPSVKAICHDKILPKGGSQCDFLCSL